MNHDTDGGWEGGGQLGQQRQDRLDPPAFTTGRKAEANRLEHVWQGLHAGVKRLSIELAVSGRQRVKPAAGLENVRFFQSQRRQAAYKPLMIHKQHPIGTRFTPASTADEVLAGIDLGGKHVIVTGGHSGLGLETTRALAKAGASVTVAARDLDRARHAVAGLDRVEVSQLDLIDPRSIDAFAARWLDSKRPLHVLVNNAALPAAKEVVRDARGFEAQFAVSHLGHFQLTRCLWPALQAAHGARVVNVSSGAQRMGQIRWDDPSFTTGYDSRAAYAQAKKANVLFAVELDRRGAAEGIRAYALHPGVVVGTPLNSSAGPEALRAMGLVDDAGRSIIDPERGKKTVQQGASTIVFAAASPLLADVGGVYLKDNDISPLDDEPRQLTADSIPSEVASHSIDPDAARRLWELSERLLEV